MKTLFWRLGFGLHLAMIFAVVGEAESPVATRIASREFPSVFQAWNPIDMTNAVPLNTLEDRLKAAAKHDVLWEEPVSQLRLGVPLVLGAVWDGQYGGLADKFSNLSLNQALENRRRMLAMNAHMVLLMEVRWRDAPGSFLPADNPYWQHKDGKRVMGWDGGNEPYYLLDYNNPAFSDNVARQCKAAIDSGVYDGVMFDWGGHLPMIQQVRKVIGRKGLILVNIHDSIPNGREYQKYINGAFMECNPFSPGDKPSVVESSWDGLRRGLQYFEQNFQKPRINCLEVWGDRKDLRRMRAATALALTCSDGSVLFADPDDLPTPDHLHDWYPLWDTKICRPLGKGVDRIDGACQREYLKATALYNPLSNGVVTVTFREPRQRASDGSAGVSFQLNDCDGDLFLKTNPTR